MARSYRRSASGARGAAYPVVRAIVPRPMDGAIDVLVRYGYLVVFGWVFAEQIGLPIPAAPVLLAAGALAGTGRLSLALVLVLAGLASLGSDIIWYWIGRTGGGRVLRWLCRISLEPDSCVRRTEDAFSVHGARSLLVAALGGYIAWKYVARQRFLRRIRIARITPEDLKAKLDAGTDVMIVDLRARIDFDADPSIIPGALHLMIEDLEARHREIPRDRDIVLYCT